MDQIKRLANSKAAPADSDRDVSAKIPQKKESMTGVLSAQNHKDKENSNNKGSQSYCVL